MLSAGCGGPTKKLPAEPSPSATIAGALAALGPGPEPGKKASPYVKLILLQVTFEVSKLKDEILSCVVSTPGSEDVPSLSVAGSVRELADEDMLYTYVHVMGLEKRKGQCGLTDWS